MFAQFYLLCFFITPPHSACLLACFFFFFFFEFFFSFLSFFLTFFLSSSSSSSSSSSFFFLLPSSFFLLLLLTSSCFFFLLLLLAVLPFVQLIFVISSFLTFSCRFVPTGMGPLLIDCGVPVDQFHELNWWQSAVYRDVKFVLTPAQHWSVQSVICKVERVKCSRQG